MQPRFRLLCGSQHLYGPGPLRTVESNARAVVAALAPRLPHPLEFGALVTTPEQVEASCLEANADPSCAGLVLWMHTFSPAQMWISGLLQLRRPFLHLHTQFARDLPWATIDMDYMNLHQAAHGDREAGHLHTRLGIRRTVVAGHWDDPAVAARAGAWMRAAVGWHTLRGLRVARLGDNMRDVAVTEGDKVAAQQQFGVTVRGHGVGDLATAIVAASDAEVDALCAEYAERYALAKDLRRGGARHGSVREAARIEVGLRAFLAGGRYGAFTTTFEDLHGLRQLPGLAVQRLMAEGFGFGAEGDWKTAALLRAVKAMTAGMKGGTSFMEDYTYHLDPRDTLVLGAHMLEVCPTIAVRRPSLEVHPLGIGGKEDPARLVFDARPGRATNASLIDLGDRFRLVIAEVEAVKPPKPLPRLPVARAVWRCRPDFPTACEAWIHAGGAHHTVYSLDATVPMLEAFADMAGIACAVIDGRTELRAFVRDLHGTPGC